MFGGAVHLFKGRYHRAMRYFVLLLVCFAGCAASAARPTMSATTSGKKLIEYGWDCPGPEDVQAHVREMEKRPFDGIVIRPTEPVVPGKRAGSIGRRVFSKKRFEVAEYQHNIDVLKAVKFEKFTDNFIQLVSGDLDFYDDWGACLFNAGVLAKIARQTECVGLMFDPEQYGANRLWTYEEKPAALRSAHTKEEYRARAIARGEEFMRAINKEFPKIQILCLFGPSFTNEYIRARRYNYDLLASFIEGMCRAADDGTQITDGYEQSYPYKFRTSFEVARREMLQSKETFVDKKAFDRVMRVGFGLWTDFDSGKHPWSTSDFNSNFFQPNTYQSAVNNALKYSDKYVWVYCERLSWLSGEHLPPAYEDAQRKGREAPGEIPVMHQQPNASRTKWVVDAGTRQDPRLFDDLLNTHDELLDLTRCDWMFQPEYDGDSLPLSPIHIARFWEQEGWDYDGYGWYDTHFSVATVPRKQMLLVVGAADESAEVWLNEEKVGTHDVGEVGWDQRFSIDITGKVHSGENDLRIRVLDRSGPGGLWRPIKIFVAK